MSRLAILNPDSLVGSELKRLLEQRRDLWSDLKLLVGETEEYATISEVAGEAALVQALDDDALAGVDVVFVCPSHDEEPAALLPRLSAATTAVFVSPWAPVPEGVPIVAGVNPEKASPEAVLVSPHPGAVALAHLLRPLLELGLEEAVAWTVEPASAQGQEGVDELLDQTRALLAFSSESPETVHGRRLALNLYPAEEGDLIADTVDRVLASPRLDLGVQPLKAGVFHSVAVSALVRCAPGTAAEEIRERLEESPAIEVGATDQPPGPAEAAGGERLLVEVRQGPGDGRFWLWGVLDNLTLGGAGNALAIAEALLRRPD